MKSTFDLPDDLMREIRIRAAVEDRRIKDVVVEALRRGLSGAAPPGQGRRQRVRLPLIESPHQADPAEEMTPERVAAVLLAEEAEVPGNDR